MNRIGGYKYEPKPIGVGRYAKVYKGYHIKTKKTVAIKIYNNLKHAKKEARIAKKIKNRTYFVRIRHFYIRKKKAYLVMDWFPGTPVGKRRQKRWLGQKLPVNEACRITVKLLQALRYMHTQNIQYRDVNPSNVMVKGQAVKIVDFGSSVVGRKKYVQLDLYLTGYFLYFLLRGNIRAYRAQFPLLKPKRIKSKKLKRILNKALHRNPKVRYKSANAFIKDLAPLTKGRHR